MPPTSFSKQSARNGTSRVTWFESSYLTPPEVEKLQPIRRLIQAVQAFHGDRMTARRIQASDGWQLACESQSLVTYTLFSAQSRVPNETVSVYNMEERLQVNQTLSLLFL